MSIEAMKQAIDALNEAVAFREGGRQKAIDAITALRTAIQQAEAKTDERAAFEAEMRCECVWCRRSLKKRPDGRYQNWQVDLMWEVWKARAQVHPAQAGVTDDVVRDAQRYRWLRDLDHWPAPFASSQEPEPVRGADLDAAIDAAMQKGGE